MGKVGWYRPIAQHYFLAPSDLALRVYLLEGLRNPNHEFFWIIGGLGTVRQDRSSSRREAEGWTIP